MSQLTTKEIADLDAFLAKIRDAAISLTGDEVIPACLRLTEEPQYLPEFLNVDGRIERGMIADMRYVGHKFTIEIG